ncbi:carotenoid oxygenase family protein [Sphingomonas prati]|uniref:Dioxygenase n=1 Tax=Sphingomonas prati TaxID=1843237 RepID=A0A7W9BVA7_9SPHN|nr:carotenoid oxygenase family protein [Sphingomonas prati]MBB5730755.1 carotenoid cleavage dioxygenase [Sphingomonas prati]GGE96523.1 carotenoid oxygenase [Sphingomonas prati]
MTLSFPETPDFSGALYTPSRFEGAVRDLEIEGEIPAALRGRFVQVAPDPAYPPMLGDDIYFNGDGAVTSFRFTDGHVDVQRRYVETDRLKAQRDARRSLHGVYRNPFTDDPSVQDLSPSTANTNIVPFNGMLLALKEDSLPYAMDPDTLETLGRWDFEGQIGNTPFTAHPKIDPESGNLLAFGYEARGIATTDMVYYEFAADGRKLCETWVKAPYAGMVHDFAVTPNYVIFPVLPATANVDRIKDGGRHFEWQGGLGFQFGVMRRDGDGSDIRWFEGPNCFQAHVLNAFEQGDRIHLDMPSADGNVFAFFPESDGHVPSPETLHFELARWTFDLQSNSSQAIHSTLYDAPCEFPRCDDRVAGRPYRHGFVLGCDMSLYDVARMGPPPWQFFNLLVHIDMATGAVQNWAGGNAECFQEPTFVPRAPHVPEGDGYILALLNHLETSTTELVILESLDLAKGPVARIKLPMRLRMSLHGNWLPDAPADVAPLDVAQAA